jgi:hypothetical protein
MRAALLVAVGLVIGIGASHGRGVDAQAGGPKLNLVVVCVNCIPDAMPQEGYNRGNILLDQNTGNFWFYPALSPDVKPRLLGTLTAIGRPLAKPPTE